MHPRLFTTLILIEPMIQKEVPPGPNAAMPSTYRTDLWPSLAAAEAAFRKSKFFARFDSRVLDNFIKCGLRRIPTAVHPLSETVKGRSFTLTTTKHQEAWSFLRPQFEPRQALGDCDLTSRRLKRLHYPDVDPHQEGKYLFYRPELRISFEFLPFVRPSVLYLFGDKGPMSTAKLQAEKMEHTGIGLGGSGGVNDDQVETKAFTNTGHMLPCENVAGCADFTAEWLSRKLHQSKADERFLNDREIGKSDSDMLVVSKKWMELVREPSSATRPLKEKL
ncbi:hypothetical protein MMC30_006713 [Trapelia coarctata]|nr:hypothetical protein [Trapelia coarctata]